jgi:N6-adenosine-specific RNA methylase IME4
MTGLGQSGRDVERARATEVGGGSRGVSKSGLPAPAQHLGQGRYRTIVADPPWPYDRRRRGVAADGAVKSVRWVKTRDGTIPYRGMAVEEIAAVPVCEMAEKDAHLYLWTTRRFLRSAFSVMDAWGFGFSTVLVWCKAPRGFNLGGTFYNTVEFVLFGRRGTLKALRSVDRQWFEWPRSAHSAKPDAFLDLVESVSPGPYAELFARRARLGWSYPLGDQALGGVTV